VPSVAPRLEWINPRRPQFTVDYVAILDVLDTNSGALVVRLPLAPSPPWVGFSHDRRFAYVTNHLSDGVTVLAPRRTSP
jgi:hypothetical protein